MRRLFAAKLTVSLAAALLPFAGAHAQSPAGSAPQLATPVARIAAAPTSDALVTLKGNTPPFAQARYDKGAASPTMATGRMSLLLARSPAQEQALVSYLGALQNPASPSYHKWLTPQTFGANFGIADTDLQAVEQWLTGQGFKIEGVPASRNYIQFSGNVGQVEQAFHTAIHRYLINGQQHYSNNADPQIPAALAPVVAGVSQLNDIHPTPEHVMLGRTQGNQATRGTVQMTAGAKPELTGTFNNLPFLYVTASDAATIYDSPNTLNTKYTGAASSAITGTGVSIGLVGDSDLQTADYLNYRKLFLGETNPVSPTEVIDGVDPQVEDGDAAVEALLDAENSAALAPGASIYFYSSNDDLFESGAIDAAARAIEDNTVGILSVSFGECEAELGVAGNQELAALWQQAAAQGITVLVASGDSGSAACDSDVDPTAQDGLAVSGFASTPYDIAVGGTDFDTLSIGSDFSQYVSTTMQNSFLGSALGYIPENPWNDSISSNPPGSYTANTAAQYPDGSGSNTTILAAGGGGPSTAGTCPTGEEDQNGNCIGAQGYPLPPFQSSTSFANTPLSGSTVRQLPDVSLFASAGDEHQAAWALCSDNVTNGDTSATYTDCETNAQGEFSLDAIGGTSTSTPAFAGILAMVSQSLGGKRLGLANQVLYNLAATKYSTVFHDVTAGNNSVPCTAGTANCGTNDFLTGYNAGTGYDDATGLGSVDISALVAGWDGVSFTPTSVTLDVNGGTGGITITHGAAVTLASTVTPSTATGTVAVVGPTGKAGEAVNEIIPLTNGAGSVSVGDLPGGTYSINAYYPGDATDAPSTSATIPVTVNPEASSILFSISEVDLSSNNQATNPTTAPYGELGYIYAQPLNTNAATTNHSDGVATGTVTLSNNGAAFATSAGNNPQTLNSQGIAAYPLYDLGPNSYSFSAAYSGDSSYNASSTSTSLPLTIQKAATVLSIRSASTTIAASASDTVTVELDTDSAGAYPGGTITLNGHGTTFTASSVAQGTLGDGAVAELATFTVPGSALASGANVLTAAYGGDANYNAAGSVTTTVTVSGTSSTSAGFALSAPSAGITIGNPGSSGTATLTITPTNGFTGTVALSCRFPVLLNGGSSPTCSLPSSVNVTSATAVTATITVATTAATAALGTDTPMHRLLFGGGGVALAGLLLFGIPARRRGWQTMLAVLLAVGLLGAAGCGSSSNSNSGGGTSTGAYTLTVTGTSGSITANTQVTVTVN